MFSGLIYLFYIKKEGLRPYYKLINITKIPRINTKRKWAQGDF